MLLKAKSNGPIKLLKNASKVSPWKMPELSGAPGFQQPQDELTAKNENKQATSRTGPVVNLASNEKASISIDPQELKAIKDAAFEEAFALGKAEGLAAASKQVEEQNKLFATMIDQLIKPISQCGEQTQQELLNLAFAIARQIVRRELQQDPTQLIAIIRDALNLLPVGAENIAISLHPEDAEAVLHALSLGGEKQSSRWQINSDPSVERGSCQVTTQNSKVDASIDKQIAVLFSRIVGGQRAGESDNE